MSTPASSTPAGRPHWTRIYGVAAAGAVLVLLGTAALAPFSMTDAYAAQGQDAESAGIAGVSDELGEGQAAQGFTTQLASAATVDLSISAVESGSGSSGDSKDDAEGKATKALYSLEEFLFSGVVNWGGYKFTFYSEQVLPGPGLAIPGRHVNKGGFVSDSDGYIVLAGDAPKGTVYETPFGHPGKIYDRGTVGTHLDVYIR